MRALVLLLLCIFLLALLQASYIAAEAKKHEDGARSVKDEDVDKRVARQHKHDKKLKRKQRKGTDVNPSDSTESETSAGEQQIVSDVDLSMPRDQPPSSEAGKRRERVSKEERLARKEQRKEKKEKRKEKKENRKETKEERKEKKEEKQAREQKKEAKEQRKERKEQRKANRQNRRKEKINNLDKEGKKKEKAERKAARQQKKAEKQASRSKQQQACTSDAHCQTGECCVPKRNGEMVCRVNQPRKAGKKCTTSCACEEELQCYTTDTASTTKKNRLFGKCVAPSAADAGQGIILTPELIISSLSDNAPAETDG